MVGCFYGFLFVVSLVGGNREIVRVIKARTARERRRLEDIYRLRRANGEDVEPPTVMDAYMWMLN
jgi:hypothetical protein